MKINDVEITSDAMDILLNVVPDEIEYKYKDYLENYNYNSFGDSLEDFGEFIPLYSTIRWTGINESQRWEKSLNAFRKIYDYHKQLKDKK